MTEALLVLENIRKRFGQREVLHDVSLTVRRGERVALLGHNGAGKSTLLRVATGLLAADGGLAIIGGASGLRCCWPRSRSCTWTR